MKSYNNKTGQGDSIPDLFRSGWGPMENFGSDWTDMDPWRPLSSLWEKLGLPLNRDEEFWFPKIDVAETDQEMVVRVNLPNVDPKKIKVEVDENHLIISGSTQEEREEKGERWYRMERECGAFRRTVVLPVAFNEDNVQAETKHGLLTIRLEKKENIKRKTIAVQDAA